MTTAWAVSMPLGEAAKVAVLRLHAGIEVTAAEGALWLRGPALEDGLDRVLRTLPTTGRYTVNTSGQIVPMGGRVPVGTLPLVPVGSWVAIAAWFEPRAQVAALPAEVDRPVELRVVRGGPMRAANVMVTTLEAWRDFVLGAAQVRLRDLRFAAADGAVVVHAGWEGSVWHGQASSLDRGDEQEGEDLREGGGTDADESREQRPLLLDTVKRGRLTVPHGAGPHDGAFPLPTIAGRRYHEAEGVAIPSGFTCVPAVDAAVLREVLGVRKSDLALLHEEGGFELIPGERFVQASRGAVRLTVEEPSDG